jgi:hypothetical protein
MPVNRVEDRAFYVRILAECRRVLVEYPLECLEAHKIKKQIEEIERRLASL